MVQAHGAYRERSEPAPAIDKAVPVAGGMAGGSADAAAALLAVDQYLYEKRLTERTLGLEELLALAAPLGADVPLWCVPRSPLGGLAVGEGTGTELRIVELPEDMIPLDIVLVAASEGSRPRRYLASLMRDAPPGVTPKLASCRFLRGCCTR